MFFVVVANTIVFFFFANTRILNLLFPAELSSVYIFFGVRGKPLGIPEEKPDHDTMKKIKNRIKEAV